MSSDASFSSPAVVVVVADVVVVASAASPPPFSQVPVSTPPPPLWLLSLSEAICSSLPSSRMGLDPLYDRWFYRRNFLLPSLLCYPYLYGPCPGTLTV